MLIFLFICFYIIGLETLPTELQRNFNLMRDLDQRTQGRMLPIKYVITIFNHYVHFNHNIYCVKFQIIQ